MKLPDMVEAKLRDPEAIVLPRIAPVKKGKMTIHYHCQGKPIGETVFPYTTETYADWFRSMADCVKQAAEATESNEAEVETKEVIHNS